MKEETKTSDQVEEGSAEETITETETEDSAEAAVETDGAAEAENSDESSDQDEETKSKLFNDEQQEIFNKRVGKEVEKRKALEQKIAELESGLNEVKGKANPDVIKMSESMGIPAAYLNESETKLLAEYDKWREVRDFCRNHKDGYMGKGGNDKDMTEDDIRSWLEKASDNLIEIAPEATALKRNKAKQLAEDAALGRKLRMERSTAVHKKNIEAKKPVVAEKASSGTAPSTMKTTGRMMTGEQFKKAGGGETAVRKFFSDMG
jgi:hypothetical protein